MNVVRPGNTQYIVINLKVPLNILTLCYNMILLSGTSLKNKQVSSDGSYRAKGIKRSFGQEWENRH